MNLGENWVEHSKLQSKTVSNVVYLSIYLSIYIYILIHVWFYMFLCQKFWVSGFSNDFRTEVKDMFTFYDLMTCDDHPIETGFFKTAMLGLMGQIIAMSHDLGPQKVSFWKGIPFSGKSRLVKYYNLARMCIYTYIYNYIYINQCVHIGAQNGWKKSTPYLMLLESKGL